MIAVSEHSIALIYSRMLILNSRIVEPVTLLPSEGPGPKRCMGAGCPLEYAGINVMLAEPTNLSADHISPFNDRVIHTLQADAHKTEKLPGILKSCSQISSFKGCVKTMAFEPWYMQSQGDDCPFFRVIFEGNTSREFTSITQVG